MLYNSHAHTCVTLYSGCTCSPFYSSNLEQKKKCEPNSCPAALYFVTFKTSKKNIYIYTHIECRVYPLPLFSLWGYQFLSPGSLAVRPLRILEFQVLFFNVPLGLGVSACIELGGVSEAKAGHIPMVGCLFDTFLYGQNKKGKD